jgi:hypothetical protein
MQRKVRTFSSGDRVVVEISFICEDDAQVESVEAIFVREGSNEEISLLGDVRKESSPEDERAVYTARLETEITPGVARGEYRCTRLFARDRFDDDWDFTDAAGLDLVVRVQKVPYRLEVTASDFL